MATTTTSLSTNCTVNGNTYVGNNSTTNGIILNGSNVVSYNPTLLNNYEVYEHQFNFTGNGVTSQLCNAMYIKIGNQVTFLQTNLFQIGLTNNTTSGASSVNPPAKFCPGSTLYIPIHIIENFQRVGVMSMNSNGTLYGPFETNTNGLNSSNYINGGSGTWYNITFNGFTYTTPIL